MPQKTKINKFELALAFQQAELRYEKKKLENREQEVYEREVNLAYAQNELNNYKQNE